MKYAIVIEKAESNYSAYAPDMPGCVTTGRTIDETRRNMVEALEFHLEGMAEDGDPAPPATTVVEHVEVELPTPILAGK